ncbi:MAG TPA: PTS sugar transporter subunit IIA [Gemmatimonadales bacterium]|nr:PTS sugar transporter subunit IIA [Gemmatimonadales bacterium]
MLLSDLLTPARVRLPLSGTSKAEVLRELVEVAVPDLEPSARDAIAEAVGEREAILSTGVGDGIAIPHAKTSLVDGLVIAVGIARPPVEFDALDGNPVDLLFLLLGPESSGAAHLKALGRLSRLLRREEFRDGLRAAPDADALHRVISDAENTPA